MDEWTTVEAITGWKIPVWARQGCIAPRVVTIPIGRELYAVGPTAKERMEWGAFEENDIGWYLQGNQLDPAWYLGNRTERIALYEYRIIIEVPTLAIMSKVAPQQGAPTQEGPSKFQFYSPLGLGTPKRGNLLGFLEVDGQFTPSSKTS